MAARLNPRHQDFVKKKIQASQLVNRLQDHVHGKIELSATQVKSADILLKKVLSDAPKDLTIANPDGSKLSGPVSYILNGVQPARKASKA